MSAVLNQGRVKFAAALGVALTAVILGLGMLPAEGHPGFGAAPTFGNAPNTTGGTGAANSTPPYAANATQTLSLRVPGENAVADGPDDTTVDVVVEIPDGWTGPTCGAALKNVNDASTNSTNQPGGTATGWTCSVGTANGHQILHWSLTGPPPAETADSAQWFTFQLTTPGPAEQTTYNGTGGVDGFIVDQTYDSGEVMHWIPNAAYPGVPPAGSTTEVATGLARTVAAAVPEAPPAEPTTVTPKFTG